MVREVLLTLVWAVGKLCARWLRFWHDDRRAELYEALANVASKLA